MIRRSDAQRSALHSLDQILHDIGLPAADGLMGDGEARLSEQPTPQELIELARRYGVSLKLRRRTAPQLARKRLKHPALLLLDNGNLVICYGVKANDPETFLLFDPLSEDVRRLEVNREALEKVWSGRLLQITAWRLPAERREFGLGWFFAHLTQDYSALATLVASAFFMNLFALVTPFYLMIVLDKVVSMEAMATLHTLTAGVVAILLFEMFFSLIRGLVHANAAHEVDVKIGDAVLSHILRLPVGYFHGTEHGVISRSVLQVARIREFLTGKLLTNGIDLLFVTLFLAVLYYLSWHILLLVLGFAVLVGVVAGLSMLLLKGDARRFNRADSQREGLLVESVGGMETVKTLALEPVIRGKWTSINGLASKYKYALIRSSSFTRTLTEVLEKGMGIAIIWVGAQSVVTGDLTVGAFVAANMVARRVVSPLSQVTNLIREYYEIQFAARLIGGVLAQPVEQEEGAEKLRKEIQGRIKLEGVSFQYDASRGLALKGIDLEIPVGALVGVVGKSGSGKSTLTRLILGLYPPAAGSVFIDGVSIREMDHRALRSQIGTVVQESWLFKGTIRENIGVGGPPDSLERVLRAAGLAGADDFVRLLPNGYDTVLEEGGANLSGGQRQLIALARALFRNPRILLLDEATSALDAEKESTFQRNLRNLCRGRTTLIISHRLGLLANTDFNIVLDRGEIVAIAPHAELLRTCELYRSLWQEQGGGQLRRVQ